MKRQCAFSSPVESDMYCVLFHVFSDLSSLRDVNVTYVICVPEMLTLPHMCKGKLYISGEIYVINISLPVSFFNIDSVEAVLQLNKPWITNSNADIAIP